MDDDVMGRAAVRTVARRARQGDTGQRDFALTGSLVCGDSPRCNRNPNAGGSAVTAPRRVFHRPHRRIHRQAPERARERVGIVVKLNPKAASIAVTDSEGHRRVSEDLRYRIKVL